MMPRKCCRTWMRVTMLAALCLTWPETAKAHLVTTGLGPLYDGISHLLVSPEDLLPVLAMSLLAGLNGPRAGRLTLFVLTSTWLLGGFLGALGARVLLPDVTVVASFLILGGLVAADRKLSSTLVSILAASLGLIHGWLNGVAVATAGRNGLELTGVGMVIFALVAMVAALVISLRISWQRIAVRVAGSWVAAIGLLMLGWSLAGRG